MSFRATCTTLGWRYSQKDRDENIRLRTHNLMDGGELSVPLAQNDRFLRLCAEVIVLDEPIFVVEQRSHPVYPIFFDLDVHLCERLDDVDAWYHRVIKYVAATLDDFFSDTPLDYQLVCSTAPMKTVRKAQKDLYKYGMHIVVPELVVDKSMMLRVREGVVQKLENNMPQSGASTWANDIDERVYENCGFRMNFSRKGSKCRCNTRDRDMCERCHGTGKVDEGRPYLPYVSMRREYEVTPLSATTAEEIYQVLRLTSVRSKLEHPTVAFNSAPPSWFEDSSLFREVPNMVTAKAPKRQKLEGLSSVENRLENKVDLVGSDLVQINEWLQLMCAKRQLPKEYKRVAVSTAFSFTQNNVRSHVIARLDSSYCMNIGREHATNTVYVLFNLLTNRACLKCYCRCQTTEGRRTVVNGKVQMCKDYSSLPLDCTSMKLSIVCTEHTIAPRVIAMF